MLYCNIRSLFIIALALDWSLALGRSKGLTCRLGYSLAHAVASQVSCITSHLCRTERPSSLYRLYSSIYRQFSALVSFTLDSCPLTSWCESCMGASESKVRHSSWSFSWNGGWFLRARHLYGWFYHSCG